MYFSREPIPSVKKAGKGDFLKLKQLGIILFHRDFILKFSELPSTPLEKIESVDMMRVLEHGEKLMMVLSSDSSRSVDTPDDLLHVEKLLELDPLFKKYGARGAIKGGCLNR